MIDFNDEEDKENYARWIKNKRQNKKEWYKKHPVIREE